MSYRSILMQAWRTTWNNKYLWFFGLFAVLLGNNGGLEALFKLVMQDGDGGFFVGVRRYAETGIFSKAAMGNFGRFIVEDPLSFIILLTVFLIFIVLGVFLFWLSVVSQAALVSNSARAETGKEHDFKRGMEIGMKNFWPVFSLNVVFKIVISFIVILVGIPAMLSVGRLGLTISNLIFVLLFIIFVPVVIGLSFLMRYAVCYVVIKDQKLKEALKNAWKLLVANWLISLEMALALMLINFLVSLAIVLIFLLLAIPILFIAFMFAKLTFLFIFWLVIVCSLLAFFFLIVLSGALLATFQTSGWTSLFVQLNGMGGRSKFARMFGKKQ